MAEFFKVLGIAICVVLVDVFFFGLLAKIKVWNIEDDDAYLMPAILNGLWFAVCASVLISQCI